MYTSCILSHSSIKRRPHRHSKMSLVLKEKINDDAQQIESYSILLIWFQYSQAIAQSGSFFLLEERAGQTKHSGS